MLTHCAGICVIVVQHSHLCEYISLYALFVFCEG